MSITYNEAKALWDFLSVQQEPKEADVIFLFGTQDEKSPDRAAELYHQGFAPRVLVSGATGLLLKTSISNQRLWCLAQSSKSSGFHANILS